MGRCLIMPEESIEIKIPKGAGTNVLVQFNTLVHQLPLWMDNFSNNIQTIKSSKDVRDLPKLNCPAIVVGAGPSIRELDHLKMLAESQYFGTIITTDRMLIPCLEAGLVPNFVCCVDGDKDKVPKFFDHPLVRKHQKGFLEGGMIGIFSAFVHPDVFKYWSGEKYFFINILDDWNMPMSLTRSLHLMTKNTMVAGTGDVGGFCWQMAFQALKCNPVALIGMDYSEKKLEDLWDYNDYITHTPKEVQTVKKFFHRHYNPFFKNFCWSGVVFNLYWDALKSRIDSFYPFGIRTINCTGGGLIYGGRVESMHFHDFLKKAEEGYYDKFHEQLVQGKPEDSG